MIKKKKTSKNLFGISAYPKKTIGRYPNKKTAEEKTIFFYSSTTVVTYGPGTSIKNEPVKPQGVGVNSARIGIST
ncbi:MAG: hypothetical protein FWH55_05420 [Oscillospiraceae bacterium]|nr:hypothetical protein [Oscillospiraceae bacterium]